MNKLNTIARIITLPGVYIRVFWQKFFASLIGIPVLDTSFLNSTAGAGHIAHGRARFSQLALYCLLPGFTSYLTGLPMFILGFAFLGPFGAVPVNGGVALFIVAIFMFYLGASLLSNVYPTIEDAKELWRFTRESSSVGAKIIAYPFSLVMLIGAYCETYGVCALMYFGAALVYFLNYTFGKV